MKMNTKKVWRKKLGDIFNRYADMQPDTFGGSFERSLKDLMHCFSLLWAHEKARHFVAFPLGIKTSPKASDLSAKSETAYLVFNNLTYGDNPYRIGFPDREADIKLYERTRRAH